MKRIYLIFAALMTLGGAKAAEYTTVEQLTSNYFVMSIMDWSNASTYYWQPTSNQNPAWGALSNVANGTGNFYLFKAEQVTVSGNTYYALRVYNKAKTAFTAGIEGGNALNPYTFGYFAGSCEASGTTHAYGSDSENNGLWTIEYSAGNGFAFKSVSSNSDFNGKYLGINNAKNDVATYWTCLDEEAFIESQTPASFTSVAELTSNYFTLETNGKLICKTRAGNQNTEAIAVNEAIAGYSRHLYKAELVSDGKYRIQAYTTTGATTGSWMGTYLNLQSAGGVLYFGACESTQYGNEGQNLGLWTITKEDDGFVFQNVGNNKYMGEAVASDSKVYFTCKNKYSDMTYTRTATIGNYLTICLPYDATITGATVYALSGVDSKTSPTKAYIEEVEDSKISAGKGYILKATATTVSAAMDATTVVATVTGNAGLVGFFDDASDTNPLAPVGSYVLSGGKWLKVVSDQQPTMTMNRAYMNVSDATELDVAPARSIRLDFEGGETTAINAIDNLQMTIDNYYNLNGQRVTQPRKGLYIVDGKKVIVK